MGSYLDVCRVLAMNVGFTETSPVSLPEGSALPFRPSQLAETIKGTRSAMPACYSKDPDHDYAEKLTARLADVVLALRNHPSPAAGAARMEALLGAVRDWSEPVYASALKRFWAVLSDLHRSFLYDDGNSGKPVIACEAPPPPPPLATFARLGGGPFTVTATEMTQLTGAKVAVVSLPGSYRTHPLLWSTLAHECGGHDAIAIVPGLLAELIQGVASVQGLDPYAAALWAGWMDEAAADVYGLLNIGPAFAFGMAAYTSARRAADGTTLLGTLSNKLVMHSGHAADRHPVDLLRVHLAIGATQCLTGLADATRKAWLSDLEALAKAATGEAVAIIAEDEAGKVIAPRDLAAMAEAAKKVGEYIASAELKAFDGRSIQAIETWDQKDDDKADAVRKAAATPASLAGMGDAAQLLAGATMALFDNPAGYHAISCKLAEALDDCYAIDPVLHPPT